MGALVLSSSGLHPLHPPELHAPKPCAPPSPLLGQRGLTYHWPTVRVRGRMSEQQKHFPEFYVTAPQPCPYLAGRLERKLFTHLTHDKPPALIDNLLKGGFRRSQIGRAHV